MLMLGIQDELQRSGKVWIKTLLFASGMPRNLRFAGWHQHPFMQRESYVQFLRCSNFFMVTLWEIRFAEERKSGR